MINVNIGNPSVQGVSLLLPRAHIFEQRGYKSATSVYPASYGERAGKDSMTNAMTHPVMRRRRPGAD